MAQETYVIPNGAIVRETLRTVNHGNGQTRKKAPARVRAGALIWLSPTSDINRPEVEEWRNDPNVGLRLTNDHSPPHR